MGRVKVSFCLSPFTLPGGAPAAKKGGSLPPPAPLSCGAPPRGARGGTREAQPRFAYPQRMREIRVVPRPMRRFVKVSNHNGEGSALWEKGVVGVKSMSPLDVTPPLLKG